MLADEYFLRSTLQTDSVSPPWGGVDRSSPSSKSAVGVMVESEQKTSHHTIQRITLRNTSQWCADADAAAPAEPDKVLAG